MAAAFSLFAALAMAAAACTNNPEPVKDPDGFECLYNPGGDSAGPAAAPSAAALGEFDQWVQVRVVGHRPATASAALVNLVAITESVYGGLAEGSQAEIADPLGSCLEYDHDYYLLLTDDADGAHTIKDQWSQFPVVKNRITLHPDMRKDPLIGELHGLDPVLFKRQLTGLTGRTDIEVD